MELHLTDTKIKEFQKVILDWYSQNRRDLPWRKTRDPYKILVSEIMLQQTQVSRVVPKYEAWLKEFPTIKNLTQAKVSHVLKMWSGLGYNRRALNLKKAAEIITRDFNGIFPQDEKLLRSLPGIGSYTSRALLCFSFEKQVSVVDTNVKKVILTQFLNRQAAAEKEIEEYADALLPHGRAYEWNQALMDYAGALLKKHRIAIPKQSKFIGSHRYYRGQVLKKLLERKKIPISQIGIFIEEKGKKELIEKLLVELQNEGFIEVKNRNISLVR